MAEGDPIDIQREKRWPNHTSAGVKVELKPWEEDSEYSDEEGVIPPMPRNEPNMKLNAAAETPVVAWMTLAHTERCVSWHASSTEVFEMDTYISKKKTMYPHFDIGTFNRVWYICAPWVVYNMLKRVLESRSSASCNYVQSCLSFSSSPSSSLSDLSSSILVLRTALKWSWATKSKKEVI